MNTPDPGQHIQLIQTPTGLMNVIRPVAERLLAEGVISGEMGNLHAADAATVKAAMIGGAAVCDFCSSPGATHAFPVPDFEMPHGIGTSQGGWAACDECHALVLAKRKKDLLARALGGMSFPKFSKHAIGELHDKFWQALEFTESTLALASRLREFADDKLPADVLPYAGTSLATMGPLVTTRAKRLQTLMGVTGLSASEIESFINAEDMTAMPPEVLVKLAAWVRRVGKLDSQTFGNMLLGVHKPATQDQTPHWQQALDAKFEAAVLLKKLMSSDQHEEYFPDAVDLHDQDAVKRMVKLAEARKSLRHLGFDQDLRLLPVAQAYSFNGETAAAIQEAAVGIPHDAPLSSVETPNTGCGWFWFSDPLAVAASPAASDHTNALLWAWTNVKGTDASGTETLNSAALMFSAYVRDTKGRDSHKLLPSTRWYWPLSMSFHEMLGLNTKSWRQTYGPGTPLHGDPNIISEEATIKVIADLSLFFVMACLWFRQTVPGQPKKKVDPVLTQSEGHVERHARKRMQREFKLPDKPTVTVVALRKAVRVAVEPTEGAAASSSRQYHVRWIVKGHPRMQACGPGRADRKLIWIESHPAGPEDKPLRTKTTVFAVVR
jgi:hypothetical protein